MTLSIREQIEKVLEKDVRPSLAEHQGDVVIVDYADHILRIRLNRSMQRLSFSTADDRRINQCKSPRSHRRRP